MGAGARWEGGPFPFSAGQATITQVEPGRRVELRLYLPLLGKMHSMMELSAAPEAGSTQVSWRLYDDVGFNLPRRLLWLLADPILGPQLERSLDKLRGLAARR